MLVKEETSICPMGGSCSWSSRGSGASPWRTASHLSAHLFHFGLHVSVLPEGHFGWEPSAQGVFGFTPPGQTFSSLEHRLNSRSATAKVRRADSVKMINLILTMVLLLGLRPRP